MPLCVRYLEGGDSVFLYNRPAREAEEKSGERGEIRVPQTSRNGALQSHLEFLNHIPPTQVHYFCVVIRNGYFRPTTPTQDY